MIRFLPLLCLATLAACAGEGRLRVESWAIQLQGLERPGAVDRLSRTEADLLVIDATRTVRGREAFPTSAVVAQLRAGGRRVLAYVNVGQAEDYRTYWREGWTGPGNPDFVLAADPDGWPGNWPAAYWDSRWRRVLFGRPGALVDAALEDGFDGVMLDWVSGFEDRTVAAVARAAGVDPARAMAELVRDLSAYGRARNPGFVVLLTNGSSLLAFAPTLAGSVDGIVRESVTFAGAPSERWDDPANADRPVSVGATPRDLLAALLERGFLVLSLDYASKPANVAAAEQAARDLGFVPFVSRSSLDRIPPRVLR